jgi:polar amino acid transport system substrate-binding protein
MIRHLIAAAGLAALIAAPASAQTPIRTAVDGTFAPHAFPNLQGGGIQGFNVDLAQEIGKRLGRPIEITSTQFSGIIPALNAGTYDFVMAPVTATPERAQSMLFTEGYLDTDFRLITRRGDAPITDLASMRGKVVSVNRGSAYESWAKSMEATVGWRVEAFGTQTDAVQAVIAGRAVANVTAETVAAFAVKNNPQIKLDYLHKTGLVWAVPTRNGDTATRDMVENAIECIKKDGTMAKIYEKWFGIAPRPDSAAATIFPGSGVPGLTGHDATPREPRC